MAELDGKVAVVSGIGPGLGRDIALLFAREGAVVVLAARSADVLNAVAKEVSDAGGQAICVTTDITDPSQCDRLLHAALNEGGGLDVLVNNAFAFGPRELMKDIAMDDWRPVFEVNVLGTMQLSIRAADVMAGRGGGSIVMINSQAMRRSEARRGAYASSKAALLAAARTLASEAGRSNVRVNTVVPGHIWGPPLEEHFKGVAARRGVEPDDVYKEASHAMALRRIATGDEVAQAALFFASDRSSGITGQSLDVNAGNWYE
jgi:NAD(P)-dependent dehydrogenase (short-subunit alcohol dehydrogenase family)